MKKIMFFAAFAAALILSSCNKEIQNDTPGASSDLITINFSATPVQTKTLFGTKDESNSHYPVLWQAGDKINYTLNFGDIRLTCKVPCLSYPKIL